MELNKKPKLGFIIITLFLIFTFEGTYLPLLYALGISKGYIVFLLYLKYLIISITITLNILAFRILNFEKWILIAIFSIIFVLIIAISKISDFPTEFITLQLFPLLTYLAGRLIVITTEGLEKIIKFVVLFSVIVCVYAIIDISFLDERFWLGINQATYLIDIKHYNPNYTIDGLIGNFFYQPYTLRIRRAIGTQGDPLAFSYSMVLPLMLILNYRKLFFKYYKILFLIVSAAIILSLTRAIILSTLFTILVEYIFKKNYLIIIFLVSLMGMLTIGLLGDKAANLIYQSDSSTYGHIGSLAKALQNAPATLIFGNLFTDESKINEYESGFLTILVNYGFIITIIYYGFIYLLLKRLYNTSTPFHKSLAITGSIGVFTSILFSESFFSFTGFGLFWLLSGVAITNINSIKNSNKFEKENLHRRISFS